MRWSRLFGGVLPAGWVAGLVAACFCAGPALWAQQDVHAALIAPATRKPAPSFRLMGEDGRPVRLAGYRGRVVLLNFWATNCGGCVLEIPSFLAIEKTYGGKAFTAVGVSMDRTYDDLKTPEEAQAKVRGFVSAHPFDYPILIGDGGVWKEYGLTALPDTYLLDRSGRIAATYVGVVSRENVEANVRELLGER